MILRDNMDGESARCGKRNNAIIDSQINSINNRIRLLCTALTCALVSHFAWTFYASCSPSSCLQCLLDCCASGGGLASMSGSGSTPWALSEAHPAHVRPVCPAGMLPCLHGGCWGPSALWNLAKEHSSCWSAVVSCPSPADVVSVPLVCSFTPMLPQKPRITWPTLGALEQPLILAYKYSRWGVPIQDGDIDHPELTSSQRHTKYITQEDKSSSLQRTLETWGLEAEQLLNIRQMRKKPISKQLSGAETKSWCSDPQPEETQNLELLPEGRGFKLHIGDF